MPAYITHSVMGDQFVKRVNLDNHIFKIEYNLDNIRTFSLGADLSHFSKASTLSHNKNTYLFFYNFINYIIDNNLKDNSKVMSCLYGHIFHYFLDTLVHPLVYYLEVNSKPSSKLINNHQFIEGFYDYYVDDLFNYGYLNSDFYSKGDLYDENIIYLLNNIYSRTYNVNNIIYSYRKLIKVFKLIDLSTKELFSNEILSKYSGFNKFLELNNYNTNILLNNDNYFRNPITGYVCDLNFDSLFLESINSSYEAIKLVNKCIYDNLSLDNLKLVFEDLSYETGVKCSYGKKCIFTKNH